MKKNLIILLTATLIAEVSFSQTNSYFLNDPVWRIRSGCVLPPHDQCVKTEFYNFYLKGDTMINTLVYKKVFKKGHGSYSPKVPGSMVNCPGSYHYIDQSPRYFLRSAGKKVFVRKANESSESMLYDFNLTIGDTLPQTYNSWETDITVTAIDSIFTADGYRKRFSLSNNSQAQYIIEGIGSLKGLIEPMGPIFECGYYLECFSMNGTGYFPLTGPTCEIAVGIPLLQKTVESIIYPNPLVNNGTLKLSSIITNGQLVIYNSCGQIQRTVDGIDGDNLTIDRDKLSAGLYFFELTTKEIRNITGKFIIVD